MTTTTKTLWEIDPTHSEVQFKVKHLVISTVTGNFGSYDGQIEADNDHFENAKVRFTADINSITTNNKDRDQHLKSDDFFNAEEYPQLKFESTDFEKGALYSYSVDSKGNQHVIRFAFDGWWMANLESFFTNKPTRLNIEVLENSELLVLDKNNHEKLLEEVPAYGCYNRIIVQNAYVALQQRVENTLGLTAEEKYARLIDNDYPFSGTSDHGVSEAIYLNDPDGNGVELYRDRPKVEWRYRDDGSIDSSRPDAADSELSAERSQDSEISLIR